MSAGKTEVVHIYPKMETKIAEAYTEDDFTAQLYFAGTVQIPAGSFDSVQVSAYSNVLCDEDTLVKTVTVAADKKWSMKIPADPFYGTLWFRVELGADGTSLYSAAESLSVTLAGDDQVNLSFVDLEGKVLILQVYGSGLDAVNGAVSHSFVELYNVTDTDISLDGSSLQYSDGVDPWQVLDLTGKTIKAKSSFLVLGKAQNVGSRLDLSAVAADAEWTDMVFNNRSFKIALVQNTAPLSVPNPFDTDSTGVKVPGYIDLIGVINSSTGTVPDSIDGYETEVPELISKQKAARRKNLTDTDNNKTDFEAIDYRTSGITDDDLASYRPKNTVFGAWNPVIAVSAAETSIVVLQVYGPGTKTDGAVSHSFVELYNTTNADIDLSGYSLQYSEGGTTWQKLDLTGKTIKAKSSFLVLGKAQNVSSRLDLSGVTADVVWTNMVFSNKNFKICLVHSTAALTVVNPFDTDGAGTKAAGYIDMLGAIDSDETGAIDGFEAEFPALASKQKAVRRKNLTDTDNNKRDFESIDYRTTGTAEAEKEFYRPKNTVYGTWNPVQE
ncbi:hypothetical protein AGMMS49991_11350 [Spirochaetia bacterium]|nr:hypothetical protein AGMMS49991_11350 [Spirochaetia bacterium]